MKNTLISNTFAGLILPAVFVVLAIIIMPVTVHAQEFGDSGSGGCCDFSGGDSTIYPSSVDYSTPYDSTIYPSSIDYSTPYDATIYPSSVDYSTPYSSSYSYPSYSYGGYAGYSYPSVGYASYAYPSYGGGGSNTFAPTTIANNGNTSVYAPTTDNTCTGNSCNTNITNPAPVINNNNVVASAPASVPVVYSTPVYYNQPVYYNPPTPTYTYPTCTLTVTPNVVLFGQPATLSWSTSSASSGWISMVGNVGPSGSVQVTPGQSMTYNATFYGYNGQSINCSTYATVSNPVAYNQTPYITLSSVPYTGLDLGSWGTAAYWGFLILWCLFAAYLIAVKRIQNKVADSMKTFLFGTQGKSVEKAPVVVEAPVEPVAPAHVVHAPVHAAVAHTPAETDKIDEFILSQIRRPAHA